MERGFFNAWLLGIFILGVVNPVHAQFEAVNDHASGPGTSTNATSYNLSDQEDGRSGPLKDIITGEDLPVSLSITATVSPIFIRPDSLAGVPAEGTPLQREFAGYVDWDQGVIANNIGIIRNGQIDYVFTGLDPSRDYILLGGATLGNPSSTNRWSLFELSGAEHFISSHTGGLTIQEETTLLENQVAINTGDNARQGDIFRWEAIRAGADGSITLTATQYRGPVPGGSSLGRAGYAPTAIKLREIFVTPVSILIPPQDQSVVTGDSVTLSVTATGFPLRYQWFKDGVALLGETNRVFTIINAALEDTGLYTVEVSNHLSSELSSPGLVRVRERPQILFPFGQTWRYHIAGIDLGTSWRELDFQEDASWGSGPGPLGFEGATLPVPIQTQLTPNGTFTYYFRTKFLFEGSPGGVDLVVTNMVDDGAVFYINGTEIHRIGMNEGPVTFSTPSGRTVGDANLEVATLDSSLLQIGTNLLAVEVHQTSPTSSDMVLGTSWRTDPLDPTPVHIVSQPQDLIVEELSQAEFEVEAMGVVIQYQWYKDGEAIPGANSPVYRIPNAMPADVGEYHAVVGNILGSIQSRTATLQVMQDLEGPHLLASDGTLADTTITVVFSETIGIAGAENIDNYRLETTHGEMLAVFTAQLANGTNVLLTTEPRLAGTNYLIHVKNVRDDSPQMNVISTNSMVPVSTLLPLLPLNAFWSYSDPRPGFPYFEPTTPGTGWEQPNFSGYGFASPSLTPMGFNFSIFEFPVEINTELTSGSVTKFFRTSFDFDASPLGATLQFRHLLNDGAIFYINGSEVLRYNLPKGEVHESTMALSTTSPTGFQEARFVPAHALKLGSNLIAAEVHSSSFSDPDFLFGTELAAAIQSVTSGPIVITSQPHDQTTREGESATFTLNGAGPRFFQWFENGVPIPNATNSALTLARTRFNQSGFEFHVRLANDDSTIMSDRAVLTVIPDLTRPEIISATVDRSGFQVTISFSEPLDEASAMLTANFAITNSAGQTTPITNISLLDPSTVVLRTGFGVAPGSTVIVNNLRDRSDSQNQILDHSAAVIGFTGYLIPIEATWKMDFSRNDFGTSWKEVNFDDSAWLDGIGIFGTPQGERLPDNLSIRTGLSLFWPIESSDSAHRIRTYYFRTRFRFTPAENISLSISNLVDDGAVFYMNGNEVHRVRMPAGPIDIDTAASQVSEVFGQGWDTFSISSQDLLDGENVFAVEVHQAGSTSADMVFGSRIFTSVPSVVISPPGNCPDLHIQLEAGQVVLSWDAISCILESTDVLNEDPSQTVWLAVPGAPTSPFVINPSESRQFYRLRNPNGTSP